MIMWLRKNKPGEAAPALPTDKRLTRPVWTAERTAALASLLGRTLAGGNRGRGRGLGIGTDGG